MFLTIGAANKDVKSKEDFEDNYGYNILRLFYALQNFLLTTSETKYDYL